MQVSAQCTCIDYRPTTVSLEKRISLVILRPHRSTTYIDAPYFYRPSSVVCLSICHSRESCKKRLKWSRCRFDRGLGWIQGTMY